MTQKKAFKDYYNLGEYKCYSFYAKRGDNYEVGYYLGKDQIFYGNFINEKEAKQWYKMMTKYLVFFTKKYSYTPGTPVEFYKNFFRSYLYKMYYEFLDSCFSSYQKTFKKNFSVGTRKYQNYYKKYSFAGKYHIERAQ